MYARIVNVQLQPEKADEGSRIVKEFVVPPMKNQKGFKGQLFFTQPDTGKAISINLWETEDDMIAFEKSPLYREVLGKLSGVLAGPPAAEKYNVSVQV